MVIALCVVLLLLLGLLFSIHLRVRQLEVVVKSLCVITAIHEFGKEGFKEQMRKLSEENK